MSSRANPKFFILIHSTAQVLNLEKYYMFEAPPGSQKMDILRECSNTLNKALATVNEKAEVCEMRICFVCFPWLIKTVSYV